MASKILKDIRSEISALERRIKVLVDAANLIASEPAGRGRKTKISSNIDSLLSELGKKPRKSTGKRGRPKGSRNKPGSKKPGPKKNAAAAEIKPLAVRSTGKKRGRPSKKTAATA